MGGEQPSPDDIFQVIAITNLDEPQARILLKKNNNDVNSAVNAFFEDPSGSVMEPLPANEWQHQDNIPFNDDSSMGGAPPMSRPPSRVDNHGHRIDLSAMHASEQEDLNDPELQRAMAESMRSTLPAQENGVTAAHSKFGPARREFYEPSSWALTTISTAREIVDHPPPTKRRRMDDEPAFLRGSKETEYLAPLVTIYHSIPLAREALLMRPLKVHNYGHDASWWSGTSDENTKALSTDSSLQIDRDQCNLLAEVQCLMAFLDKTDRAYGSVDALADLQAVRAARGDGAFIRWLTAWSDTADDQAPSDQLNQVFTSVAAKGPSSSDGVAEEKPLLCVEPPVNRIPGETLVNLLDSTIWDDERGLIEDVWIAKAAEIFTVRVYDPHGGRNNGLDLTLDPVWFPDRYMFECRGATRQIRKQLHMVRREIDHCTHLQHRCEMVKLSDNRVLMIRDVLDAAAKVSMDAVGSSASASNGVGVQDSLSSDTDARAEVSELGNQLQQVVQRIEQKLQLLEMRKSELRQKMREIALQLTKPTPESPNMPQHKYTLQGVSTKPTITYLRRPNTDLLMLDQDDDSSEDPEWQWWRLAWIQDELYKQMGPAGPVQGPITQSQAEASKRTLGFGAGLDLNVAPELTAAEVEGPKPYEARKVTEAEVLEAIKSEHSSVVLVYANEYAMSFPRGELNMALKHFVNRDNQAFHEELESEEGLRPDSSNENGTIDFEDVPLTDQNGSSSSARELTPMSTSSLGRDEDGQASPKRIKCDSYATLSELPPSYEEISDQQEMQEKKGNRIGLHAEQMMQKYGEKIPEKVDPDERGSSMHIENDGMTSESPWM
ncbi:hypothetical protein, variant 1 [Exophiala mesophila]|uniref:UBA domain-containing protein n=2 Tax=Exophiala mesophila TaxID=212818 RepID=A0A0D1Z7H5_EXOME|nr:hypothetical protein, variant 1 [Exophiala mesophila]KIV90762.1 hypothetical protein, variant 1 [Exophiala mesophila]